MTDYIKREDARHYINIASAGMNDVQKVVIKAMYYIDRVAPADVRENITAHKVIGGGEHKGATCWFECSRCGKTVDVNDKYCSECGARFEA